MSFRADIGYKDGIHLSLVVVRDQINILFTPVDNSADNLQPMIMREYFTLLTNLFKLDHEQSYVRGADAEHLKRHHVYSEEGDITHLHINFDKNVTPKILKQFLEKILKHQVEFKSKERYRILDKILKEQVKSKSEEPYQF